MKRKGVKNNIIYRFVTLLLIKIIYDYITVNILDGLWYSGYGSYGISFNWSKEIVSFVVFIFLSGYLLKKFKDNSFIDVFIYGIYAVYYIPLNSAYAINDTSNSFFISSSIFIFLMLFFCSTNIGFGSVQISGRRKLVRSIEKKGQYANFLDKSTVRITCFIICMLCFIYKIMYNGFDFSLNIFSAGLYDSRAAYVDSMEAISGSSLAYVLTIIKNISSCVAPFYLYYGIKRKNIMAIGASMICLISLFSIAAGKETLLFIVIIGVIWWCENREKLRYIIDLMLLGIMLGLLICIIIYKISGSYSLYFIIFRRQMYYPAWLNTLYYDYFYNNPKIWYSQGTFLLQNIIPSYYNQTPIQLISSKYFNSLIPSPNTGMFADAYMNLGNGGIVVFPVLLSILLRKSESIYWLYGEAISIIMAFKLVLQLSNVPIFRTDTVLSFWVMTIMLYILPKFYLKK